jgi:hypothetical protein
MPHTYQVVELNFDEFYDGETTPEGRIFSFSRRTTNSPLPPSWQIPHWEEIDKLMTTKFRISEKKGQNCSLIEASRHFFHHSPVDLFELTRSFSLSLPELSLIVKQGDENRIFIPNFSINQAKTGVYSPHKTLDSFFNSDSFNLIRNVVQYTAANPDQTLPHSEQTTNYMCWVSNHAERARELLHHSLEFHPRQIFVEGQSPDLVLADYGHPPYEDIVDQETIRRSLSETINGTQPSSNL